MTQMTIDTKIRHHSPKDVTASIGKNNQVYITFRNGSHKHFTSSEYMEVWAANGAIHFGEGSQGNGYKLSKNKTGKTPNYYIKFSGNAKPEVTKLITKSLRPDGSVSFDLNELEAKEINAATNSQPRGFVTIPGDVAKIQELEKRVTALEIMVTRVADCFGTVPTLEATDGPKRQEPKNLDLKAFLETL